MIERLHRVAVVAPQVDMTVPAIYAAIRAGQFPYIRIGRRIRIPESLLQQWLEEKLAKNTKAQEENQTLASAV
jgi:excisionase family DNA binding protein